MRILVLFNPIAGAGRAADAAGRIGDALSRDGHAIDLLQTRADGGDDDVAAAVRDADVMIVVGGDGTVRSVARHAVAMHTPIWQFPLGTENLFAREFGMKREVDQLREAIRRFRIVAMDVGSVNDQLFLMMVSIGFDAYVIHDLASRRTGGISHFNYLGPILRTYLSWRPRPLEIAVDGKPVATAGPGMTVIASARQYAFRLDPAPHASITDGLLHLVHIPVRWTWQIALLAARARLGRLSSQGRITTRAGREITIHADAPSRVQIDGDVFEPAPPAAPATEGGGLDLRARVIPAALQVLTPA